MHHTYDDTEMATIRRSGSGWQVLIRRKNYVGPRSRTFLSRDLAESWADAVEERTKKVFRDVPITLGEAINDYINGPLLLHRSAENEKYPLRVTGMSFKTFLFSPRLHLPMIGPDLWKGNFWTSGLHNSSF